MSKKLLLGAFGVKNIASTDGVFLFGAKITAATSNFSPKCCIFAEHARLLQNLKATARILNHTLKFPSPQSCLRPPISAAPTPIPLPASRFCPHLCRHHVASHRCPPRQPPPSPLQSGRHHHLPSSDAPSPSPNLSILAVGCPFRPLPSSTPFRPLQLGFSVGRFIRRVGLLYCLSPRMLSRQPPRAPHRMAVFIAGRRATSPPRSPLRRVEVARIFETPKLAACADNAVAVRYGQSLAELNFPKVADHAECPRPSHAGRVP